MSIESEILPDNPAARLQSFLDRMLEIEYDEKEKISSVLSRVLEVSDSPKNILPHYSQLFVLIDEAYSKVMQYYPKQQRTHLAWQRHFTSVLQKHSPYHHDWKVLIGSLRQGSHLDIIQVANDNLEHFVKQTKVHGLTIEDLELEVSRLIEEINNSGELSDYLKMYLKEELENILNTIKHFDLYGSDPVKKSIYNILGNSEVSKNMGTRVIKGVGIFLVSIASAIGVVNDAASFPESLKDLRNEFLLPYIEDPKISHAKSEDGISNTAEAKPESNLTNQSTARLSAPDS